MLPVHHRQAADLQFARRAQCFFDRRVVETPANLAAHDGVQMRAGRRQLLRHAAHGDVTVGNDAHQRIVRPCTTSGWELAGAPPDEMPSGAVMFEGAKSMLSRRSIWVAGALALFAGSVAAQATDKPQRPPPVGSDAQPSVDKEIVVKPPAKVDPRLAKPAPGNRDPGMVERPPADARPGDGSKPRVDPSERSRQDDCRGAAEDCKQNSPR
jgi:hypothetical protein